MKLSKAAIKALNNDGKLRKRLAYELNVHITSVDRWIEENEEKEDSRLTTVKAVNVISEETGMSQDEILINVSNAA